LLSTVKFPGVVAGMNPTVTPVTMLAEVFVRVKAACCDVPPEGVLQNVNGLLTCGHGAANTEGVVSEMALAGSPSCGS